MHEGIDLLAELYPRCFSRTNRRPLKIGVCEEVISQHLEMSRHGIKHLLKTYTQRPEYWSTLTVGTPRIDLAGNVAGEVTAADEEDAKRKIAKAARRAAVTTIEDRKEAGQPAAKPLEERARQHNHSRRQNLDSRRRPNRLSVGPHRLAGRGSSPRIDPGSVPLINRI